MEQKIAQRTGISQEVMLIWILSVELQVGFLGEADVDFLIDN